MPLGNWQLQPFALLVALLALVPYAVGWTRLRRTRPDQARVQQAFEYGAGVLAATLALVSPLDRYGLDTLFSARMAQILILSDIAPLLIVAGLRGQLCSALVSPRVVRVLDARLRLRHVRRVLLRPWLTLAVWIVAVYVWHIPALYDAAATNQALLDLEAATFVAIGLLVWVQIIDPAHKRRLSPARRAVFAAGVLLAGSPLVELLLFTTSLYPRYTAIAHRPFHWSANDDQVHAALLMMGEQITTLCSAAGLLLWEHMELLDAQAAAVGFSDANPLDTPESGGPTPLPLSGH
jgi:cytochrome c oxidase assembly factor CtaG